MGLFRGKKKPHYTKATRRKIRRHHGFTSGFFRRRGTMLIVTPKKNKTSSSRGEARAQRLEAVLQGHDPDWQVSREKVGPAPSE